MPTTYLPADLSSNALPRHVAVIMDGNGRWAAQQGLPRMAGHRQGAQTLKALLRCCKDWGIPILTVYAFSTENWQRPQTEVAFLLRLFDRMLCQLLEDMQEEGVQIQFWGDLTPLPDRLRQLMEYAMATTQANQAVQFNVAVNYGGQQELVAATRRIAELVATGQLQPEQVDEGWVARSLYSQATPPPDLLIRTSGEQRLSNFLLWQLAYTELYFTDVLWPAFDRTAFHRALVWYQGRQRRFGRLPQAQDRTA